MAGYIKLHRQLMEHWLWDDKPFSKGQAWIDLLLLATWKEAKELYKGKIVQRNPGEVSVSMLWLADRWCWHRDKVARFLRLLDTDGMATTNTTTNGTTITIANWALYQNDTQPTQQPMQQVTQQPTQQPLGNRHNNHLAHHKKVKESKEGIKEGKELDARMQELIKHRGETLTEMLERKTQ